MMVYADLTPKPHNFVADSFKITLVNASSKNGTLVMCGIVQIV